jgi:sarcosine/dimethylglycine N-methyltransferase
MPIYDEMINFSHRLISEKKIFENLLDIYPAEKALDAGCGSGFHTILLSQLGLDVTGLDNSDHMLRLAKENSKQYKSNPSFLIGDFTSLNKDLCNRFDGVFCLGNSFVHLLSGAEQQRALRIFKKYLQPKGFLCIQIINYDKIIRNRRRILADRDVNGKHITRLYVYNQSTITFKVRVESENKCDEYSTELYPMQSEEFISLLEKERFVNIKIYGDLKFNEYQKYQSENICIFCNRE